MQPKRLDALGEIRRRWHLPALAALVFAVSFAGSCPGTGNNNNGANNNNGGVTTQSSPTSSPGIAPPPLSTDDRPIIISGGSLDLDFNPVYYLSSGSGTFRSSMNRITTMRVYDDDATDVAVEQCSTVTFSGASDITIAYSIAGGGSGTIRVNSVVSPSGNHVDLTFNATQLPKRNPNSNKYYNKKASIDSITYTGGTPAACNLGGKKKVTVELEGTAVGCSMTMPSPSPTPTP